MMQEELLRARIETGLPLRMECRLGTSNKFWQVRVSPGTREVERKWGRIGTEGQTERTPLRSYAEAVTFAVTITQDKQNKGYVEVAGDQAYLGAAVKAMTARFEERIQEVIRGMREEAMAGVVAPTEEEGRRYVSAASTASGLSVDLITGADVYVGDLDDEKITDLASKLAGNRARRNRPDPERPSVPARLCPTCENELVSRAEVEAGRCASCLLLQARLRTDAPSVESGSSRASRDPLLDKLEPVRKIRFVKE